MFLLIAFGLIGCVTSQSRDKHVIEKGVSANSDNDTYYYGIATAVDGNFAIVAGCLETVFIYEYNTINNSWHQSAQLLSNAIAADEDDYDNCGFVYIPSVDINENVAIIGVNDAAFESAYLFEYNSSTRTNME